MTSWDPRQRVRGLAPELLPVDERQGRQRPKPDQRPEVDVGLLAIEPQPHEPPQRGHALERVLVHAPRAREVERLEARERLEGLQRAGVERRAAPERQPVELSPAASTFARSSERPGAPSRFTSSTTRAVTLAGFGRTHQVRQAGASTLPGVSPTSTGSSAPVSARTTEGFFEAKVRAGVRSRSKRS